MKKILVFLLAVLLLGTVGMAKVTILEDVMIEGAFTLTGTSAVSFIGLTFALDFSSTIIIDGATSVRGISAGFVSLEGPAQRFGANATDYMSIAVTATTGAVAITHTGNNKKVTWTTTGGFDFVGAFETDAITGVGNLDINGTTAVVDGSTSFRGVSAALVSLESPDIRFGFDASDYMKIAVATGTGDVTITHTGTNKSVAWTAAAGFTFTGGITNIGTISAGTWQGSVVDHERGGLEADVNAYDGLVRITGGATSAVTVTADALTLLASTNFLSMTQDLSVEIGVDTQAYHANLTDIAGLTFADDYFIIGTGAGTIGTASCTAFAQTILDDTNAANVATTIGLGTGDSPTFTGLTLSGDLAVNGGDITSSAAQILVTTNSLTYRYSVTGLSWDDGLSVQTDSRGLQVQNGEPLVCVGLDGGVAEVGTTEGYVSIGDDSDFLRFIMPIPALWADDTQTTSLSISFDLWEKGTGECNIDVRIFEYGNITPIVIDTIAITDAAARAWNNLVTLSTGFGAVATLTGDDSYLVIEMTSTANADDWWIYGARLKYRVGLQATQ